MHQDGDYSGSVPLPFAEVLEDEECLRACVFFQSDRRDRARWPATLRECRLKVRALASRLVVGTAIIYSRNGVTKQRPRKTGGSRLILCAS